MTKESNFIPKTTICQKVFIVFITCAFVALTALTASLPFNLPYHQLSFEEDLLNINSGDTTWILVATLFGFLLSPCLALLYAHAYGKDSKQALDLSLISCAAISFLWIVLGFSLTYGVDANGVGVIGFPRTYYMFHNVGAAPSINIAKTVSFNIFAIFELTYALIPVTIIACSVSDRVSTPGFLFFITFWHLCGFCPVAHIMWSTDGYFSTRKVEDFAGGIAIHILTGLTVIVLNAYLDWRKIPHKKTKTSTTTGVTTATTKGDSQELVQYTIIVWLLYTGVIAGKIYNATPLTAQVIVNILAATTSSIMLTYLIETFRDREFTLVSIFNAVMIGLVSISSGAGYVTVGGAMVISITTVLIIQLICEIRYRCSHYQSSTTMHTSISDPLSIFTLHAIGGTCGFLCTAVLSYDFINSNAYNGLTFGYELPIIHHAIAVMIAWVITPSAVCICILLSNMVFPLTVSRTKHIVKKTRNNDDEQLHSSLKEEIVHNNNNNDTIKASATNDNNNSVKEVIHVEDGNGSKNMEFSEEEKNETNNGESDDIGDILI